MSNPTFKPHWGAARKLLERDCHELFGMGFGSLCKAMGVNVNTALAQIRRGIPLNVVMDGCQIIQRKDGDTK
jgi:hypothetical protein